MPRPLPDRHALDSARNEYVTRWKKQQAIQKQRSERQLAKAQTATQQFLKNSAFDKIIRSVIHPLCPKLSATKILKELTPLDGEILDGHLPAFIVDNLGLVKSSSRIEVPGLKYSFYLGLDQIIITVSLCRDPSDNIYPVFTLAHVNGLYHRIDWKAYLENPSEDLLTEWLRDQIHRIVNRKNLEEPEALFLTN